MLGSISHTNIRALASTLCILICYIGGRKNLRSSEITCLDSYELMGKSLFIIGILEGAQVGVVGKIGVYPRSLEITWSELIGKSLLIVSEGAHVSVQMTNALRTNLSKLSTSLQSQRYGAWWRSLYKHTGRSIHIMFVVLAITILQVKLQMTNALGTNFSKLTTSLRPKICLKSYKYTGRSIHTMYVIVL